MQLGNANRFHDHSALWNQSSNASVILRIGTLPGDVGPFVRTCTPITDRLCYHGMVIEIVEQLAETLKFRYDLLPPPDGHYGVLEPNTSTFTGLVGMLERKEIDMVATDLTTTYARSRVIDYAPSPFYYDSIGILIRAPKSVVTLALWGWFTPFSWPIWLCLLGFAIVFAVLLYLGHYCMESDVWFCRNFKKLSACFAYILGGYINKSVIWPKSLPWWGQTLLAFWWLLCVLEVACYGSHLMATLTAPTTSPLPFSDLTGLGQLVRKGEYKVCVTRGTSFAQTVLESKNPEFVALAAFLRSYPSYMQRSQNGCIALMANDTKVAYLAETYVLEAYQQMLCGKLRLVILKDDFYTIAYSLAFQKGSPLTRIFNLHVLDLVDQGLPQLWYKRYSPSTLSCAVLAAEDYGVIQPSLSPLFIRDLFGVFILLSIGLGISLVSFVIELL